MMKVVLLGTSASVPTKDRSLPAVFLIGKNDRTLFDCGEGTQRQLMAKNLHFMKIDRIFITHWHADHFAGLLGLIQTMSMEGRERPLHIYGPKGTEKFVSQLVTVGHFERGFDVMTKDLAEGEKVRCDDYQVVPFSVTHRIPALGYSFEEKPHYRANMDKARALGLKTSPLIGRLKRMKSVVCGGRTIRPMEVLEKVPGKKIVYTGDTQYSENVAKFAKGADLLICDSTYALDREHRTGDVMHCTSTDAARIAKGAGARKLVLTHISRRYQPGGNGRDPKILVSEARKVFRNTILGEDFMEFTVK